MREDVLKRCCKPTPEAPQYPVRTHAALSHIESLTSSSISGINFFIVFAL